MEIPRILKRIILLFLLLFPLVGYSSNMSDGKKIFLWLDDVRNPMDSRWKEYVNFEGIDQVVWVKNYREFTEYISKNGIPYSVSFDHDLEPSQYIVYSSNKDIKASGKNGLDCAKWMIEYCIEYSIEIPIYSCHSFGKEKKKSILNYLDNASKIIKRG